MSMLNVRLPNDTEDELDAVAQARSSTKSDIAREAINAYLSGHYMWLRNPDFDGDTDDFSEFGTAVTDALRKILHTLIDGPPEDEWDRFVEPLYQVFKERVIAQSLKWGRPQLSHERTDSTFLTAPVWFAMDDLHDRIVPLHELIYRYADEEGEEAFEHVRKALALAQQRLADDKAG